MLVAVMNDPEDLVRAQTQGWYRIPLAHAPPRVGADFLAFYQTGAFPPQERWTIRWIAPVRGYHLTARRELIPEQSDHPRADARYYRVNVGELAPLPHPVPSRRLRRVTFIRTTLERLVHAQEINDLWIRTPAQERLWQAMQEADLADAVEHEYSFADDFAPTADFAVIGESERIALLVVGDAEGSPTSVRERTLVDYLPATGGWRIYAVDCSDPTAIAACVAAVRSILLLETQS